MKRLFFVLGIVIVIGVVGAYAFLEFTVPNIVYVNDTETLGSGGNDIIIRRLYTAEIDVEGALAEYSGSDLSERFLEEEYLDSLQASSEPLMLPAFYFNVSRPDTTGNAFELSTFMWQETAKGQIENHFRIENLTLDIEASGFEIEEADFIREVTNRSKTPIILSDDRVFLNATFDSTPSLVTKLSGTRGTLELIYKYDIVTNNIFPTVSKSEQILMLYVDISYENNVLRVEYIREPYSSLEDMQYA
ncbi:MAG: hypothetical protein FWH05_06545 [Oscillospiraceae bacterium]|nr:hypothetical protein [Oscillospiraceae bacterium]